MSARRNLCRIGKPWEWRQAVAQCADRFLPGAGDGLQECLAAEPCGLRGPQRVRSQNSGAGPQVATRIERVRSAAVTYVRFEVSAASAMSASGKHFSTRDPR